MFDYLRYRTQGRRVHLVIVAALLVIAIDAFISQSVRKAFLTPEVWATIYTSAAGVVLWFIWKNSLRSLQFMTIIVGLAGLFRGVAFVVYDGRLTPMALNTILVSYAYLAHQHERGRITLK